LPTAIGVLFIVGLLAGDYFLKLPDKSPVILQASNDGGFNACWLEFREDGTYKFGNSGGIGAEYFRGDYEINDSIIILDKSTIDRVILTNRLVIRPTLEIHNKNTIKGNDTTLEKFIYQIDKNGKPKANATIFKVNEDNRKQ
jgi:hypothetical protein